MHIYLDSTLKGRESAHYAKHMHISNIAIHFVNAVNILLEIIKETPHYKNYFQFAASIMSRVAPIALNRPVKHKM